MGDLLINARDCDVSIRIKPFDTRPRNRDEPEFLLLTSQIVLSESIKFLQEQREKELFIDIGKERFIVDVKQQVWHYRDWCGKLKHLLDQHMSENLHDAPVDAKVHIIVSESVARAFNTPNTSGGGRFFFYTMSGGDDDEYGDHLNYVFSL